MNDLSQMTREQLEAMVARMQAAQQRKLRCKVGEKGGVTVIGIGRYGVTLYRSQWEQLIPFIKSGAVDEFITDNAHLLATKDASGA